LICPQCSVESVAANNDENEKHKISNLKEKLNQNIDGSEELNKDEEEEEEEDQTSEEQEENNEHRNISDEDLLSDSESEFTEPSYEDEEDEDEEKNIDLIKKTVVNNKIYVPPEQVQIHSILSSGKILDYSKDKPYEKFDYNFKEFKKQNNDKVNNRVKELTIDLLSEDNEKTNKYKEAYNMDFQKTKEKEAELIEKTMGDNFIEINAKPPE